MTPQAILGALGIYGGAFAVGAISSVIPIVAIDVFVVGIALACSAGVALVAALFAAAGQLVGKLPIFYAARGAVAVPGPHRDRLDRLRARLARWRHPPHLVLATSALAGLPPFSVMATAAGALSIRPRAFSAIVMCGRALRFMVIVAITCQT